MSTMSEPLPRSFLFQTELQSLRGIAVLCVSIFHSGIWLFYVSASIVSAKTSYALSLLENLQKQEPLQQKLAQCLVIFSIGPGSAAVIVFFVLSGYVLTLSWKRTVRTRRRMAVFVERRFWRLYPAATVSFLVWEIAAYLTNDRPFLHLAGLRELVLNMSLLEVTIDPITWSLRLELSAIPLLLLAWKLSENIGIKSLFILEIALLIMAYLSPLYGNDAIGRHLFCFIAGVFVYELGPNLWDRLSRRSMTILVIVSISILALSRSILSPRADQLSIYFETAAASILVSIVAYDRCEWLQSLLTRRPVKFLGKISYSYYLYNYLAIQLVPLLLMHLGYNGILLGYASVICISALVTIPVACASYRWLEMPFLGMSRTRFALASWRSVDMANSRQATS